MRPINPYRREIQRLVRNHITDSDLTPSQAAETAGISQRTLYRVLAGSRDLRLEEAVRLGIVKPIRSDSVDT